MKKHLFIFAVATLALAGCSKEEPAKDVAQQAISFNTWTEALTRARAQGSSTFASGDTFKVFGVKTTGTTDATVFDGVTATYGTAWTYSPVKYWDFSADSYKFYAYSNATGTVTYTASSNDGEFAQAAEQTFAGNNGDVLVAREKTVAAANFGSAVALVFDHITSVVDVKVKAGAVYTAETYPNVKLNSVTLNAIENSGKFTVDSYNASTKAPEVSWSTAASPAGTTNYTHASGVTPCLSSALALTSSYQYAVNTLIVKPQDVEDTKTVTVNYTIYYSATESETVSRTVKLNEFRSTEDSETSNPHNAAGSEVYDEWEQGNRYIYNITISASPITFTASITAWVEKQAYWWIAE